MGLLFGHCCPVPYQLLGTQPARFLEPDHSEIGQQRLRPQQQQLLLQPDHVQQLVVVELLHTDRQRMFERWRQGEPQVGLLRRQLQLQQQLRNWKQLEPGRQLAVRGVGLGLSEQ